MIDLSYLFILLIHNIHFIHFSMIDLYPNLIITDFHYDFFYDYFITLLFTSIWLTYTTELSFIYIIYLIITSILFVSLWLIYTTDISLIYTIFVLFYLSNLTQNSYSKFALYIIVIWQYSYSIFRIINYQTYRSNFILNSII